MRSLDLPCAASTSALLIWDGRYCHLSPAMVSFFAAFLAMPESHLKGLKIRHRWAGIELPWLGLRKGGGAMVLGESIFLTAHFFNDQISKNEHQFVKLWLDILSHELVHVRQIHEQRSALKFYARLIWQYISVASYSRAGFEREAENERARFRRWITGEAGAELMSVLASTMDSDDKCRKVRGVCGLLWQK
jgi:hypothetical protein